MKPFDRWWKQWRRRVWRRGYDCAAGELLRGASPRCIEGLYDLCDIEGGEYAEGIREAIADWNRLERRSKQ
jgi:hypothetical protein